MDKYREFAVSVSFLVHGIECKFDPCPFCGVRIKKSHPTKNETSWKPVRHEYGCVVGTVKEGSVSKYEELEKRMEALEQKVDPLPRLFKREEESLCGGMDMLIVRDQRSGKERRGGVVCRRNIAFWTADPRKGERRKR